MRFNSSLCLEVLIVPEYSGPKTEYSYPDYFRATRGLSTVEKGCLVFQIKESFKFLAFY